MEAMRCEQPTGCLVGFDWVENTKPQKSLLSIVIDTYCLLRIIRRRNAHPRQTENTVYSLFRVVGLAPI